MYKLLLVFCLLTFAAHKPVTKAVAKKQKEPPTVKAAEVLQIDSSNISVRNLNADSLKAYSDSPDFTYHANVTQPSLSWWDRFWIWFWEMIAKLFGGTRSKGSSSPIFQYLIIAIAVGLLVYVIVKALGLGINGIFNRESKEISLPYSESLENIHQITFEEEIEKALSQRNYRLAVRLLYLNTLKQLTDARLIHWQVEKTNSAYLNELTDSGQRQSFSILTRQFEYVWYGDFPVDGQSYQSISALFHDFKKTLS